MSMPFYVSPEQVMKDRADYARKGIARGRSLVALECAAGVLIVADNPSRTLSQDQRDLRPHRVRRGRQVQRVPDAAHRRRPPRRPQGLLVLARGRERQGARQRVRADARPGLHARDEAVRGRAPRRRGRPTPTTTTPRCTTSSTTASSWTSRATRCSAARPSRSPRRSRSSTPTGIELGDAVKLGAKVLGADDEPLAADQLEVALLDRARPRRAFRRIKNDELERRCSAS